MSFHSGEHQIAMSCWSTGLGKRPKEAQSESPSVRSPHPRTEEGSMCHMSKAHRTQPSAAPETQGKSWSWAAGRGPPAGIAVRSFYHTPYAQVLPNHWVFEKGVVGAVSVAQSCAMLCEPAGCSPPDSSVHGILQARILEWAPMPSSRGSS